MKKTIKISLIATVALVLGGCEFPPDDDDKNTTVVVENTNNITISNINDIAIENDNQAIAQNSNSASRDSIDDEDEGSEAVTITDTHPNYAIAKTNGLKDVSTEFNGQTVTVTTNKSIDDVSPSSIAIYGKVGGNRTDALLKLNSNYQEGSKFVVKVYKHNKLVAISQELDFRGESINFNDI